MRNAFLLFGFLFLVTNIGAQAQFAISSGKVSIQEESTVSVQANLHNHATLSQEGTLTLKGDWKNIHQYFSKQGTIVLAGTNQNFFHNNQSIHNLWVKNAGNVHLSGNLTISGKLGLEKSILTPTRNNQLVIAKNASIETSGPDAYVNGALYHTGVGSKFYPIGKNNQYAPVTLTQITGNDPVVGLEFYESGLSSSPDDKLQWLDKGFYWQLTHLSGEFDGSPLHLETEAKTLPFETEELVIAVSNNLSEGFGTLPDANFQISNNRYLVSTASPVQNSFISIGLINNEKKVFYLPNVLSPLAPNPEDRAIKIYSEEEITEGFSWVIRDQWGHIVFTTDSYAEAVTKGWQGLAKAGNPVLPGIYYYTIKGKFASGDMLNKKGNLVVIE